MKTQNVKECGAEGSVLLITLGIVSILSFALGGYLYLVRAQMQSVARSQSWNAALAVAEAGVEEALAQMNPSAALFNTNIDLGANGWGGPSDGVYGPVTRSFTNAFYRVTISNSSPPVIYSTGYVTNPAMSAILSRTVRVTATNAPLFQIGMVVINTLDMKGNNVTTDSYDSRLGPYSSQTPGANGNVASLYGMANVNNGNIQGTLFLGPTASDHIGPGGVISGGLDRDFNVDYPEVLPVFDHGVQPIPETTMSVHGHTTNFVTADYTFGSGDGNYFVTGDFNPGTLVVPTNASVVLYVTGSFGSSSAQTIRIQPGASLQLYVGGGSATFTPPFFTDTNPVPQQFQYYGLRSNTNITVDLTGNSVFTGAVYAPNAAFSAKGNGTFYGGLIVNSATMTGNGAFHYDVSLGRPLPMRGYVAASWQEL